MMNAASLFYQPRYRVTMNCAPLEGVFEVNVSPALAFQVGTFHFSKIFVPGDAYPAAWWAATDTKTMLVTIEFSLDGVSLVPMISGNVDSHSLNINENTLAAAGRDLGALMVDTRTIKTYRNQVASDVATQIATSHGLQISATKTIGLVGRIYETDHDKTAGDCFSKATNAWDLLCLLGLNEGVAPYMQGNTLYFNPPPASPPVFACTGTTDESGRIVLNVDGLTVERHLTAAREPAVRF